MNKEAFYRGFGKRLSQFVKRHGVESIGKKKMESLLKSVDKNTSLDSLILWPVRGLSKKILGEKRYNRLGKKISKAIYDVDAISGKPFDTAASKLKLTKNLFKQEELVPVGRDKFQKIHRTSLMAPAQSVSKIVVPMVAADVMYNKVRALRGKSNEQKID